MLDKQGALSSAAFITDNPDCDIVIGSSKTFDYTLNKLSNYKNSKIFIFGLASTDENILKNTEKIFKIISDNNNTITWIITFEEPGIIKLCKKFKSLTLINNTKKTLTESVIEFFNIKNKLSKKFIDFETNENPDSIINLLVNEAKFHYFNYDNYDFYPELIKKLSNDDLKGDYAKKTDFKFLNSKYIFGKTEKARKLKKHLEIIGKDSVCNVLIEGESGTGKTSMAYSLHFASNRKNKPFKIISCANIPENLFESVLFGHKKGAFTGADKDHKGEFELADGGTVFLDEIGELPLNIQSKLLLVLQDGIFTKVGDSSSTKVDIRIVSATNRDLKKMIAENKFREDLYYRISTIKLNSIPLREQIEDIELFANNILKEIAKKRNKFVFNKIPAECVKHLKKYNFPGNVRELENIIERAFILDDWDFSYLNNETDIIKTNDEIFKIKTLNDFTADYIKFVFEKNNSNITKTAKVLNVSINTVKKYIKNSE
ncbi:MAG: sigma-54 dependent transcriptional regulator, partial [Candidatus Muiribacteriota bacterium]